MPDASRHGPDPLRLEHDALARRLESRPSVDVARHGLVLTFVAVLALGISWALFTERYGKVPSELAQRHPVAFVVGSLAALVLSSILLVRGIFVLRRGRQMARDEAALYARLRELRRGLGLDP